MPIRIPPRGDDPQILIFDSAEELQKETGQSVAHGYFDPKSNSIFATADSVAHEIGHYLDFKSGRLKSAANHLSVEQKTAFRLRNEVVAILFAYAKCGDGGASLPYEYQFIKWLRFMRTEVERFGPHHETPMEKLKLAEIQNLADWLTDHEHPWFERLRHFFQTYLVDEDVHMTYGFLK